MRPLKKLRTPLKEEMKTKGRKIYRPWVLEAKRVKQVEWTTYFDKYVDLEHADKMLRKHLRATWSPLKNTFAHSLLRVRNTVTGEVREIVIKDDKPYFNET